MSHISSESVRAREQARQKDGKFGTQPHAPADVGLDDSSPVENPFTRHYKNVREKIAAIQAELDEETTRLANDPKAWQDFLNVQARFPQYSLKNQMLLALQKASGPVAGYKAWKALGRQVRKGEKGRVIFAPIIRTIEDEETGEKTKTIAGYTTATVFDYHQTEGEPIPGISPVEISGTLPPELTSDLETAISKAGFKVKYTKIPGGPRGTTSFGTNTVYVDSRLNPAARTATLAHELAHISLGHGENLEAYHTGHGGHRGRMEVEAESVAYIVCRANGFDDQDAQALRENSGMYVSGWAKAEAKVNGEEEKEVFARSQKAIAQAAKTLLTTYQWSNTAQALPKPKRR